MKNNVISYDDLFLLLRAFSIRLDNDDISDSTSVRSMLKDALRKVRDDLDVEAELAITRAIIDSGF
jgi:hypothetical protein